MNSTHKESNLNKNLIIRDVEKISASVLIAQYEDKTREELLQYMIVISN